jgi:hypothetical protein
VAWFTSSLALPMAMLIHLLEHQHVVWLVPERGDLLNGTLLVDRRSTTTPLLAVGWVTSGSGYDRAAETCAQTLLHGRLTSATRSWLSLTPTILTLVEVAVVARYTVGGTDVRRSAAGPWDP